MSSSQFSFNCTWACETELLLKLKLLPFGKKGPTTINQPERPLIRMILGGVDGRQSPPQLVLSVSCNHLDKHTRSAPALFGRPGLPFCLRCRSAELWIPIHEVDRNPAFLWWCLTGTLRCSIGLTQSILILVAFALLASSIHKCSTLALQRLSSLCYA